MRVFAFLRGKCTLFFFCRLPCGLDLVKFYQHEKLGRDLFKTNNLSIVVEPEGSDCAQST